MEFRDWLKVEMKKRRYSQLAFSKEIGISQPFVSRVLSGEKQPSIEFCIKVAQALGESPEKLLRMAGILPNADETISRELFELFQTLTPDQREEVLKYIKYLIHQSKKGQDTIQLF